MKRILVALLLVAVAIFSLTGCDVITGLVTELIGGKEYTVTFDTDGGSLVESQTVKEGECATEPAAPTKSGNTFAGWFNGEVAYDFTTPVTADITLTAKWEEVAPPAPTTYTVTFNTDGGSEIAPAIVEEGKNVAEPSAPTKVGYTFAGWYVGDVAYDFAAPVTANVEITAKWTEITYTVTFDAANGAEADVITVNYGATVAAPAAPEKEGFTFDGWYAGDAAYDFTAAVYGDITLTAKWTQITYTVTFDAANGAEADTVTVNYGATVAAPAAPEKEGFIFDGWYAGDAAYDFTAAVYGDITLTAKWIQITYNVTFDAANGAEVETITVNYGATVAAPAAPEKEGFEFAGWYAEGSDVAYDFTAPVYGDIALTARWATVVFDVTFNADNGSEAVIQKVVYGETANAPAAPEKEGFIFDGWYAGDAAYDFTAAVYADVALTAKWTQITYTVTFDAANGAETDTITVNYGATVAAPAAPSKAGFKFVGWYAEGAEAAYDFTAAVYADVALTAKWELDLPDLTAIAGTYTGTETDGLYINNKYTFVINADGTITASYENSYTSVDMTINYVIFENNVLTINYTAASTTADLVFTYEDSKLSTDSAVAGEALTIAKTYSVIFDSNGANKDKTYTVVHGETITEYKPTRTGYDLEGWYLDGVKFDFATPITSDVTLVANWEVKMVEVTFLGQDGVTVEATIKVAYNTVFGDIEAPTSITTTDGYKFNGKWYSSATATSPVSSTSKLTSNKSYYPGLIAPMTDIDGTWTGTDSKGNAFTMVVNGAEQTVSITTVNGDTVTEYNVASIYYKEFAGISSTAVKLVIRYTTAASSTESTLTLTYTEEGTFTGSNSLTLAKEGIKNYTVSFDTDGGSAVVEQTVLQDATAEKPEDPTKDGFKFLGWYLGDVAYDFATPVTSDITLTAKWEEVVVTTTYTVTFTNGSSVTSQEVAAGECAVAPADPTKSGKKFMGWFNGDAKFDATAPITSDIDFVAKWGYEVTFYTQSKEEVKKIIVEEGTAIPADEIPEPQVNEGFVFSGVWHKSYTVSAAPVDVTANITGATKLYPGVIADGVTILDGTWNGQKTSSDGTVTEKDTFIIDVIVDENGKVIGVNVTATVIDVEDDTTLTYTPEQMASVQYNASGSNMQLCIKFYKTETSFATYAINYTTDGIIKYGSSVILEKEVPSYTVSFDSAGGSAVEPQTVKEGSVAAIPEAPTTETTGVVFGGWYLGEEKYDFATPVTGDITLTAKWVESKNLTFYKQNGDTFKFPAEKGKTLEAIITDSYEDIMAGLTDQEKSSIVKPATFDEMIANLVDALCTIEGSYYTGLWHTSLTGTTAVNFSDNLTANKNITPAFIAPDVIAEIEGTWIATKADGTVTGTFTTTITRDDAGNIIDVKVKADISGTEYDSLWIKTYTKTDTAYQILVRYQKTATSQATFTIKQATVDGVNVWQYSSGTFVQDNGGPKSFVVSFDSNGADAVASQTVVEGETATAPTAPTKAGFAFAGWYVDDIAYDFSAPVTKNITVVAKWTLDINTADVIGSWGCTIVGEVYGYETKEEYLFTFFADGSVSATVSETMAGYTSSSDIDVLSLAKLVYENGNIVFCEKGGSDITLTPKSILDDVKGTWTGNEDYAGTMIPYTLTVNEDGTISGMCDMFGHEYIFTLVSLDNKIVLDCMGSMTVTLVFDGEKLVGTGVMGASLTMTPYVAADDVLTFDQIAGTWSATEDFYGMTFNYTFVINEDGTGSAKYVGDGTYETVMSFDKWVIENNKLVLNYNIDGLEYDPLTFSLVDGKLVGVGPMGTEITLEK